MQNGNYSKRTKFSQADLKAAQELIRRSAGEKKGVDVSLEIALNDVVSTTGTNDAAILLNGIAPGNGSWNRIGKKTFNKSIRLFGIAIAQLDAAATTENYFGNTLRMVVVWDKQPSGGTIPTFDTVFGVTDSAGLESSSILDPVRYDNMGRFQILRDKRYTLNPAADFTGGTVNTQDLLVEFDEYIKLGNRETIYSGEDATIASISTGALYVYFRGDTNSVSSRWTINERSRARLRYSD